MKTNSLTWIVFAFLLFLTSFLFYSCFEEPVNDSDRLAESEKLKIIDFAQSGKIHNDFLNNVKLNFRQPNDAFSFEEKIEYINGFNIKFIDQIDLKNDQKDALKRVFDSQKKIVQTEELVSQAFNYQQNGRMSHDATNLRQTLDALHDKGVISDFGFQFLTQYLNDIKENYEGRLSEEDLKTRTLYYIGVFEAKGYPKDSGEGQMIGHILSISLSSIEWWEENPDAFEYDAENGRIMIAPWAAADIVGGILGGATSAGIQYGVNEEVNWEIVGWSALAGAIYGSTGAVGKIAKWLL